MRYFILSMIYALSLTISTGYAQQTNLVTIKGTVTDVNREPQQGVNVWVKTTPTHVVVTDQNGNFSIAAKMGDVLQFSKVGLKLKELTITSATGNLNIAMEKDSKNLDEVVVIGYGSVRRKDLTGSVTSVKASDMVKSTDMSLNGTLQGRAAGVQVISSEGAPGADVSIAIRAGSSISASNEPLYVIDGFPQLGGSNLNLNVNDIESLEVLKDASATAIYGSRGANGVIIITTKTGKAGKFNIAYDGYYSLQKLGTKRDVLNSLQYAAKQHYTSASLKNSQIGDSLWYNWATYKDSASINWQDELYKVAPMHSHNLSFTGGSADVKIAGSINYTDQDGIAQGTNYKRYSARLSSIANISKSITNSTNIALTAQDRTGASLTGGGGLAFSAIKGSPFLPPNIDLNEYLLENNIPLGGTNGRDPLVDLLEPDVKNLNYYSSLNTAFSFKLTDGLVFKVSGGMTYTDAAYNYFYGRNTSQGMSPLGIGRKNNSISISLLNEYTLNYSKSLGKGNLDAVAGASFQKNTSSFTNTTSNSYVIEALGYNNLSFGSQFPVAQTGKTVSGLNSYFGRAQYALLDKYIITATLRADGSSKFPQEKWGYFPSGAIAWKVNEERFMRAAPSVSTLKLRLSYGMTGNESIPPYSSYTSYGSTGYPAVQNNAIVVGVVPTQLGSKSLKWETTIASNLGLDLGLFKDRILITADAYVKKSKDLLLQAPLSNYSGFTTVTRNIGDMQVKGMEFNLSTVNLNGKLRWNTNFNIAFNKTKVLALNDNQTFFYTGSVGRYSNAYIVKVGESLGSMYGYVYDGVIHTQEELAATVPHNSLVIKEGTRRYKDISGVKGVPDGVVDANDRTAIGNGNPKFFGGVTNDFSYGPFDFSFLFTYSYGNDILNGDKALFESPVPYQGGPVSMLNRWTPTNPQINQQRWDILYNNEYSNLSSYLIEDGSYLRLKNIQLAYNVNRGLFKKLPIKAMRVYVTAQNLLTLTHYTGYDPEVNYLNSIITPGADLGAYPRSKVYTFGLNITF